MELPKNWSNDEEQLFKQWAQEHNVNYDKVNDLYPLFDYRQQFRLENDIAPKPGSKAPPVQKGFMKLLDDLKNQSAIQFLRGGDLPIVGTQQNGLNLKWGKKADPAKFGIFYDKEF